MPLGLVSDDMLMSKYGIVYQNFNSLVPGNFLLLITGGRWKISNGEKSFWVLTFIFSQWKIINIYIF